MEVENSTVGLRSWCHYRQTEGDGHRYGPEEASSVATFTQTKMEMKTILTTLLACLLLPLNGAECDERLQLEFQFYSAYPDPPATDVLLVVWRTMCPLWRIETSTNLVQWVPYGDWYYNQCDVTNGHQTNCSFHIIERPNGPHAPKQTFYRLQLHPGPI